jgi:hypothetical protein
MPTKPRRSSPIFSCNSAGAGIAPGSARGRCAHPHILDGCRRLHPSPLPPHMPGELPRHDRAQPRPFTGEEMRPVGGAGEAFAVGGAEVEEQREAAFAECLGSVPASSHPPSSDLSLPPTPIRMGLCLGSVPAAPHPSSSDRGLSPPPQIRIGGARLIPWIPFPHELPPRPPAPAWPRFPVGDDPGAGACTRGWRPCPPIANARIGC